MGRAQYLNQLIIVTTRIRLNAPCRVLTLRNDTDESWRLKKVCNAYGKRVVDGFKCERGPVYEPPKMGVLR